MSILKEAGITNREAAKIVGVSEVMMWKYQSGKVKPKRKLSQRRLRMLYDVLETLVRKGQLPKPNLYPVPYMPKELREKREAMISKIMFIVDQKLGPFPTNT